MVKAVVAGGSANVATDDEDRCEFFELVGELGSRTAGARCGARSVCDPERYAAAAFSMGIRLLSYLRVLSAEVSVSSRTSESRMVASSFFDLASA